MKAKTSSHGQSLNWHKREKITKILFEYAISRMLNLNQKQRRLGFMQFSYMYTHKYI